MPEKAYDILLTLYGQSQPLVVDSNDADWALDTNRIITYYVLTPIAIIGVFLNCMVVYTWNTLSPTFKVTIFLFKALAVSDIVFVTSFCLWWYSPPDSQHGIFYSVVAFGARYIVVNITLLLAITRWIFVRFIFNCTHLLSKFRTFLALGVIIGYCVATRISTLIVKYAFHNVDLAHVMTVAFELLLLCVPMLVQIILSFHLLWMTTSARGRVTMDQTPTEHAPPSIFNNPRTLRNRRLTFIVVLINTVAFLAYPVGISIRSGFRMTEDPYLTSIKNVVFAIVNLLHVLNSSINFFFYCAFTKDFRKSLQSCLCQDFMDQSSVSIDPRDHLELMTTEQTEDNL